MRIKTRTFGENLATSATDLVIPQVSPETAQGIVEVVVADSNNLGDSTKQYRLAPKVIVSSSAERNTKGRVRILPLKLQLGYSSLTRDEAQNVVADPARSGGEIEIHLVVSLPRACAQDADNSLDSTARDGAYAQIAAALSLFNKIVDKNISACGRHWHCNGVSIYDESDSETDNLSLENPLDDAVLAPDGVGLFSAKTDARSAGGLFDGVVMVSLPAVRKGIASVDGTLRRGIKGLTPLTAEVEILNPMPFGTARAIEQEPSEDSNDDHL